MAINYMMDDMETDVFLKNVLADDGLYALLAIRSSDDRRVQKFYPTIGHLIDGAVAFDAKGYDSYFGLATYDKDGSRKADNVKELKSFGQSAIDTNIQTLQDENVFDIQKTKSYLQNLNEFSKLEDNINNNFGGNIELWAQDYVAKEYEKKVFSEFGLQDIANNKIDIQPSEAFGEIGKERVKELVNNYNNVKNSIDELGIDFSGGVDATNAFVDEQYQTAINNLTETLYDNRDTFQLNEQVYDVFNNFGNRSLRFVKHK